AAAVAVALVPAAGAASLLSAPSLAPVRAPALWRVAPLPIGLVLVGAATIGADGDGGIGPVRITVLIAGGITAAIGLIVVIPVFTHVIGGFLVRIPGGPALRIAGRRLQSQPAGVSRIVAGLLIGLFVVSGGRMVLGAWEGTPQYQAADRSAHGGQIAYDVYVDPSSDAEALATRITTVDGVRAAYPRWQLSTACGPKGPCISAFVGTCADLVASVPDATGCRDEQVAWLDHVGTEPGARPGSTIAWTTGGQEGDGASDPGIALPAPGRDSVITAGGPQYATGDAMQAQVFIPADTPGVRDVLGALAADTAVPVAVEVDAGTLSQAGLRGAVRGLDPSADVVTPWDDDDYDFVSGLRALMWAVAAVVLAVGLLGFAIATIDRTVSRRAEMVSLQLVGTGRGVIRAAQWWEAAVPLSLGVLLALASGSAVGLAWLSIGDGLDVVPWGSIGALAAVSVAAAVAVAGLTVVACAPRIRAELIRRA
ncbi:MAG: hypothetical protein JWM93_682, partial [Frankiales bacterium]|nr:hypothetical protein [Frankiales bacterium]